MEINSDLFKKSNFQSSIQSISFQQEEIIIQGFNYEPIPVLIILLENKLKIQLARRVSWTDYDPEFYTIIKHNDIDIFDKEWTNAHKHVDIEWKQGSREMSLKDLLGKKVSNIGYYLWSTLIDFEESLFIELTNNKSSQTYSLIIGLWIDKENNSAEKLLEIDID